MKRLLALLPLLALVGACAGLRPPKPPIPPSTDFVQQVYVRNVDNTMDGVSGATVRNDFTPPPFGPTVVTTPDLGAAWGLTRTDMNICATLAGYLEECFGVGNVPLIEGRRTYTFHLKKIPPPPVPTHAELVNYRGNFCNLTDAQGRVIFDPFIASLPDNDRLNWYATHRAAGSTHIVMSPEYSYSGAAYPIAGRDMLADPQTFRKFVLEATQQIAADGKGFRVAIFLDGGAPGIRQRIDTYWKPIIDALADLKPFLIWNPGWELIKASPTTSNEYSYALGKLHEWLPAGSEIWPHLSVDRASWASNPIEADDPWQGAESGAWKDHNGQWPTGFFFQTWPLRDGDNFDCDPTRDDCYLNRVRDVVPRLGNGMNGWRVVPLAMFEGPAYYFFRHQLSPANIRRMMDALKRTCDEFAVTCLWGNGLPTALAPR